MKKYFLIVRTVLLLAATSHACYAQLQTTWKIHDPNRPLPPVIDPATASSLVFVRIEHLNFVQSPQKEKARNAATAASF